MKGVNRLTAFHGSAACKTELAGELKDDGALCRILLAGRAGDLRFDFLHEEYGLEPSLLRLMVALCWQDMDPVSQAFLRDVVEGIEPGTNSVAVVTAWLIWCLSDPQSGLLSKLGGPTLDAAGAVGAALERSRGGPVPARVWRTARRNLGGIDAGPVETRYLNAVAAMAWDLGMVPGLVQDVVMCCGQAIRQDVYHQEGWSTAKEIEVVEQYRAFSAEASKLAEVSSIEDPKERHRAQEAAVDTLWRKSGKLDLLETQKRCASQAWEQIGEWTKSARAALVAGARASSQMIV